MYPSLILCLPVSTKIQKKQTLAFLSRGGQWTMLCHPDPSKEGSCVFVLESCGTHYVFNVVPCLIFFYLGPAQHTCHGVGHAVPKKKGLINFFLFSFFSFLKAHAKLLAYFFKFIYFF